MGRAFQKQFRDGDVGNLKVLIWWLYLKIEGKGGGISKYNDERWLHLDIFSLFLLLLIHSCSKQQEANQRKESVHVTPTNNTYWCKSAVKQIIEKKAIRPVPTPYSLSRVKTCVLRD